MPRFEVVSWVVALGVAIALYATQGLGVMLPQPVLWGFLALGGVTVVYGLFVLVVRILLFFPKRRRAMTLAVAMGVGAVIGAGVGGIGWWFADRYQQQIGRKVSISLHASRLRPILQDDLGIGDKIEYDMRGDATVAQNLTSYGKRIEDWRTLVGTFLAKKLPNSGADTKFLGFRPRVGQGGARYEYERLNDMRDNLRHIIDNLESYCAKSSTLPDGVEGLVQLRTDGVALRNRSVGNDSGSKNFHHEFEAWQKAVVREMRSIGVRSSDIAYFETLDLLPAMKFRHAYDERHDKDLRELTEKLQRLMKIIQRHDQR